MKGHPILLFGWNRNFYIAAGLGLSLGLLGFDALVHAQGLKVEPQGDGFFFDSKTKVYFCREEVSFALGGGAEGEFEVSLDGTEFEAYRGSVEFEEEGEHHLHFRSKKAPSGKPGPAQVFRVLVDMKPPSVSTEWKGPVYRRDDDLFVHPSAAVRILAEDQSSGVDSIWIREGKQSRKVTGEIRFEKTGEYEIEFAAQDRVGNRGDWKEEEFVVDGEAPSTRFELEGPFHEVKGKIFLGTGTRVRLLTEDRLSGVKETRYRINGGETRIYSEPVLITEGDAIFEYRSEDQVTNRESWKRVVLQRDSTPPALEIRQVGRSVPIGGRIYALPGFEFQVKVSDIDSGLAEVRYSRDGSDFDKLEGESVRFEKGGEYVFKVRAVDRVGNAWETADYVLHIDADPPRSKLMSENGFDDDGEERLTRLPNLIRIESDDDGVGVDRVEYSLDGGKFRSFRDPINPAAWKNPRQLLRYRSVDRLGNREEDHQVMIRILRPEKPAGYGVEAGKRGDRPLSVEMKDEEEKR